MRRKLTHAQPEHLWSTRGKHAPITCIPVPRCHGVPCIFLIVLLSYAAIGLHHDHGEKRVHSLKLATSSFEIDADARPRHWLVCQPICLWTGSIKGTISTFETLPAAGWRGKQSHLRPRSLPRKPMECAFSRFPLI